ncbi:MAG: TonB-dependent receptor [Candidatus Omnitrophica bacterium]|nr:TonB-dependent receptor [Candidatus Omnitrophota bacterium]
MKGKIFLNRLLTSWKISVYISFALYTISTIAFGGEGIELKPVVIMSTRIRGNGVYNRKSLRSQESFSVTDNSRLSLFSFSSLLNRYSMTDTRTRGPYGVQSDISLRGAPFEQNLILLNGVSLNDPKSGHHNMDIPLTLYDTDRVDVTYGAASSIYGSGALGGAVNIVPKEPSDKPGFTVSSAIGYNDFYSEGASLETPLGRVKNRASFEWKKSSGFAPETEFNTATVSSYSKVSFDYGEFNVFIGYLTKKFGAANFYSDRYPNEEESVNTGLMIAKGTIEKDIISVTPVFYLRRHQDKFILDRNMPFFSRNDHTTYSYGGEMTLVAKTALGKIAFGGNVGDEEITSSSMGDHSRLKTGAFLEYENNIYNIYVNTSLRFDRYTAFNLEFSPSFNVGCEIFPSLVLKGGVSRSYRVPSFTDLYYSTAANKGNEDLRPERAWTYETGFDYTGGSIAFSGTIFLRNTTDIIDWTKSASQDFWQAENIGEFDMYGIENIFKIDTDKFMNSTLLKGISFRYCYLEALDKKNIVSKYVLEYLKHNIGLSLGFTLPWDIKNEVNLSFKKRIGQKEYLLIDSTLYKEVNLESGKMVFFIEIKNALNMRYTEQGNVKMPGFTLFGGASVKF